MATHQRTLISRLQGQFPAKSWQLKGHPFLSLRRLVNLIYFKFKRRQGFDYSYNYPGPSDVPIDIFMPTLEKDALTLDLAIDYARKNIKHPITNIYIVGSAKSTKLQAIAKQKKCKFVDERKVLDIDKQTINYEFNGFNKNGWIYKMLLNLNANSICTERYILVIDSDTLFIKPQVFLHKGKTIFNMSDEYHKPYFDATKRIVGVRHPLSRSFITHYMLMDSVILDSLHQDLEKKWQRPWYQGVIDNLDKTTAMAFADYECYADYFRKKMPFKSYINYWSNLSVELKLVDVQKEIDFALASDAYMSLSLHTFKEQTMETHER